MEETRRNRDELAAIQSLGRLLDAAQIDYWLFGGWAVDFWVGRVTRPHDDIDAAAWRSDYDAIRDALTRGGWKHAPTEEDIVGTNYTLGGALVQFTFMETGDEGEIVIPVPGDPIIFPMKSFGDERRTFNGVTARVIPLAILREGKATPRPDDVEAAKDRADAQALRELSM